VPSIATKFLAGTNTIRHAMDVIGYITYPVTVRANRCRVCDNSHQDVRPKSKRDQEQQELRSFIIHARDHITAVLSWA